MEKDKVPQDDENLLEGKKKLVQYAIDENGNYIKVLSSGWEPENIALTQAWEVINKKIETIKSQVLSNNLSPLAYYIEKNMMDVTMLSQLTRIPKRIIKKHLIPENFKKINQKNLSEYAFAFNISVEELVNPKI